MTLIYAFKKIVTSEGVHNSRIIELKEVVNRMFKNKNYYSSCSVITTNFNFFKKIVDNWFENEYNNNT